jgi:uncharacterized membrane protein YdfJ with MMPL/SSD domain
MALLAISLLPKFSKESNKVIGKLKALPALLLSFVSYILYEISLPVGTNILVDHLVIWPIFLLAILNVLVSHVFAYYKTTLGEDD